MGLIVLLIVSAAAMVAMIVARRPEREDRSIASYRSALDTIGGAAARARRGALSQSPGAAEDSENEQRRVRLKRPVIAIAVVVVVAGLTTVLANNMGTSSKSSAAPPATRPSTTTSTTIPPSTTAPAVVPVSADEQEVVFAVGPSVSLLIVANDRCWVGAQGPEAVDVFEGTLEPGGQQPIDGATPLRLRLGSPTAVDVFVNGVRAQVPAQEGTPVDLVFEGS